MNRREKTWVWSLTGVSLEQWGKIQCLPTDGELSWTRVLARPDVQPTSVTHRGPSFTNTSTPGPLQGLCI